MHGILEGQKVSFCSCIQACDIFQLADLRWNTSYNAIA